jgi:acyl-coenzyme A synthetase/AMP-(fatty) acid ligase
VSLPQALSKTVRLFQNFQPEAPAIYYRGGNVLTQGQLLAAGYRLAERLDQPQPLLNLSQSRAEFVVGLIATLISKSTMLLPISAHANDLARVQKAYGGHQNLVDFKSQSDGQIFVSDFLDFDGAMSTDNPRIATDQTLAVAFTSGSTGDPQPHEKTWGALSYTAQSLTRRFGLGSDACAIATIPSQHMYGLEMTAMALLQGGIGLFNDAPFFPKDIVLACHDVAKPWLITTPVHLKALLSANVAQSELAGVVSATAPLTVQLAQAAEEAFSTPVQEIYGCTEAGSVATRFTTRASRWDLLDGITFISSGDDATISVPGIADPVPLTDEISLAGEGFELLGRGQDMINVAGKRFSLARLNAELLDLREIEDGIAFLPDDEDGIGRPAALVVSELSGREINRLLTKKIAAAFVPRPILNVVSIPRNAIGKVLREDLMKLYRHLK